MRTTLDLPDEVLRRVKIAAVERSTTLRALVEVALCRELAIVPSAPAAQKRAKFPIFASASPGALVLTNADLARQEANEDARRHGRAH